MSSLVDASSVKTGRETQCIVKVGSDKGYLRLRFSYAGKRYALTLGLPDTKVNRVFAQQKAAQIELDIISGNFDPKLEKYKPQRAKPEKTVLGSVHAWFAQFAQEQIKDKGLNKGSVHRYSATQKHLEKFFKEKSVNAIDETAARGFVDYLKKKVTTRTAKDYLILVQAFWKWGMDKQGLKQNPWSTLVAGVKPPRKQKVRPFTVAEVQAILAAFRGDRYYNHYADFVTFLFGTGCRFGEAVALKWKHIADDCKSAWIGESVSRGIRKTTKTGKDRTINLTPKIMAMLLDRKPNPCDPEALVFPAPKGSHISDHTFRRRAWKTILAHLEIQYRKPYATRHTAISQALANGANPLAVAEETGHDPETLFKWYASVIAPQAVMVEF